MGTEEDSVDEAARTSEPPVIVAPPGLDIDPEVKAAEDKAADASDDVSGDAGGAEPDGLAGSGAGASPPPSATVPGSIMAPPVSASGSGGPAYTSAERKPSFTPSPSSSASAVSAVSSASSGSSSPSASSRQAGSGEGRSLWREVRPPSPPTASPAYMSPSSGSQPGPATAPAAPGTRPASAAGFAGSVASAFQGRNAGGKRKRPAAGVRRSPRRQAQLTLSRVEPWSVMKFSFVVSVVAFIILFVAVAVLYMVLSALGVFTSLEHTVSSATSSQGTAGTDISGWFSASRILGYTGMLGALNIVLITAMSTIGAVIYNLIATTIGGVEVTLRETD